MKSILGIAIAIVAPSFAQVTINELPSREFGQPLLSFPLTSGAPNLVEGREFNGPSGIAFDYSVSPPAVYVADTGNNRVLAWKNSAALANGAFADKVIGQRDFYSSLPQGPSQSASNLSTGLFVPVGLTVDSRGNLYVIDAGNNRVLRYPTPLTQTGDLLPVDLVIGQRSVSGAANSLPNEGNNTPSNKSLFFSYSGTTYRAGLGFDPQGNLWVTDAGNNRVLRFPVANLTPNTIEPAADLVLGQTDFTSFQGPQPPNNVQSYKSALVQPSGLAFDSGGRLYVADGYARVLVYQAPAQIGQAATRVLGIQPTPQPGQSITYPTNYTLGLVTPSGSLAGSPQGVFTNGTNLFVTDTPVHRVVRYDAFSNWSPESATSPSPASASVTGQLDAFSGKVNRGLLQPDGTTLSSPVAGAFNSASNEIWIVDTNNHRVIVFPQQAGQYNAATRLLGQVDFAFNSPNLIEGREVAFAGQGGIVVDKRSNPPHLYIADTANNRVLGFLDARKVGTDTRSVLTQKADLVIGQQDLLRALPNFSPSNFQPSDAQTPNSTGLLAPVGLAVDANGNLFVADSGNGRVLRFPAPFDQPAGTLPRASLVLGQSSFTSKIQDASSSTMSSPYGLALFNDGTLAASDSVHHRILIFQKPAGGDFTTGQSAAIVLGQKDFSSSGLPGTATTASLNTPHHIAADSSDRLYVCDTNNGRVLVFTNASKASNGASAALVIPGINSPQGVAVSSLTGESWVTNTGGNQIFRFPEFTTLQLNPQPTAVLLSAVPLSLALDPFDNLIVGEAANRVTFYFPKMYFRHQATYAAGMGSSPVNMTPGMLALLARYGSNFSFDTAGNQALPWPTTGLNDVQVLVNGIPAPVFRLDAAVIYFQVPMTAPTSGTADLVVIKPSTGQILAASTFAMQAAAPGIFTANQQGTGQAAATNSDGSPNSASNAALRGSVITLWLTGAGFIPNLPPDGTAPGGAVSTPLLPKVFLNGLPATNIQYSGVSPQFPGLWQINLEIPQAVPPGNNISVLVLMSAFDYPSNYGGTSAANGPGPDRQLTVANGLVPTIAVK